MPETTLSAKPSREALKQQLRDEARRQLTPNEFAQCEKIIHNAVLGSTGVGVAKLAVGLTAGLGGLAATALAPMAVMPQKLAALFGFQLKKT